MRSNYSVYNHHHISVIVILLLLIISCSEDKPNEPTIRVPTMTTASVTKAMQSTALCGGEVTSDGGATVIARGVCWCAFLTPTTADSNTADGSGTGSFASSISGLASSTKYYVRAYATNSNGTGYGDLDSFTTAPTLTDADGNSYQTVIIGTQVWMAENLNVTHYRNGETIARVTDNATWDGLTTAAYCEYLNNTNHAAVYGRLYNSYAVLDGRNIAPSGWHVPTDAEWQTLVDYLGGEAVAGGKLKEAGAFRWADPNTGATDESGFCARPGGARGHPGSFGDIGQTAHFWSSTETGSGELYCRRLSYDYAGVFRSDGFAISGFSVRCVKD